MTWRRPGRGRRNSETSWPMTATLRASLCPPRSLSAPLDLDRPDVVYRHTPLTPTSRVEALLGLDPPRMIRA